MEREKTMRHRLPALILAAVLLGGMAVVMSSVPGRATHCTPPDCTEDIRNTKHNLAANADIQATGTTEVCVFCHTPHGGRTDVALGNAPLWNRALPPVDQNTGIALDGIYQVYTSPNFDAQDTTGAPGRPKGVSLACLSCHDGAIALDALINAPGSGGFIAANRANLSGSETGTSLPGITFSGQGVDGNETMKEGLRSSDGADPNRDGFQGGLNDFVFDVGGGVGMEPFPNLGRNLTDDHPISIEMPTGDPQFAQALQNLDESRANIAGVRRGSTWSLPNDVRDWVRLYRSVDSVSNARYVECASCHNPHTPRTTFLRLPSLPSNLGSAPTGEERPINGATRDLNHEPNQGSLICLTCHQK